MLLSVLRFVSLFLYLQSNSFALSLFRSRSIYVSSCAFLFLPFFLYACLGTISSFIRPGSPSLSLIRFISVTSKSAVDLYEFSSVVYSCQINSYFSIHAKIATCGTPTNDFANKIHNFFFCSSSSVAMIALPVVVYE